MFCGQCGAKNNDNAAFCASCGAALKMKPAGGDVSPGDLGGVSVGKKNHKVIGIVAVIVVVAVIAVAAFLIGTKVFGNAYNKTATKFITAAYEMDVEGIFDLIPEDVLDYLEDETGYDIDVLIEEYEETLEKSKSRYWSYVDDVELKSCEVLGDSDVKGSKLADLKEKYEELDIDILEAKTVRVRVSVEYYGEESKGTFEIPVVKIGRKWYLDVASVGLDSMGRYYNF